jgi:uncharacterized protein YciI
MYFIVLRENSIPRLQWPSEILAAHLSWAQETFASGTLRLSGPANESQGGAYLIEAANAQTAREILDRDPINTEGYCTYRLVDWNIQRGKEILLPR